VSQRRVLAAFAVGLILGGVSISVVLYASSALLAPAAMPIRAVAFAVFSLVAVARDLHLVHLRLPENARLVPIDVLASGLVRGAIQFGFEMGTGVRTFITASAPYVLAAALLLIPVSLAAVVAAGAFFGLGRMLMLLFRYWSRSGERWDALLRRRFPLVVPLATVGVSGLVLVFR
jgi:hypothetical protein